MRSMALAALLLAGCGARPTGAPAPAAVVLQAPPGVDRWEPSGAVALDGRLWVVNDREGWIAGYDLPLADGVNAPTAASRVVPPGIDKIKWEGAAPAAAGGLLMLEAFSRTVWRCADPAAGCPALEPVDVAPANAAIDALLPGPVEYVIMEGLAAHGDRVLVGTRAYLAQGRESHEFQVWSVTLDAAGTHTYDGAEWSVDGRTYGLSGIAFDGPDTLWSTWSFEDERDETSAGVSGLLARAEIDPATGLPGRPHLCRKLDGKAEGIAVLADELVLVFDNDKARKSISDRGKLPVPPDRDYAALVPKDACAAPLGQMP